MTEFKDLFTPRQLLALSALARFTKDLENRLVSELEGGLAEAVQICLSIAVSKLADFSSSLCVLNTTGGRGVKNTFVRQALSVTMDFMETNPFNEVGASWMAGIEACVAIVRKELANSHSGQVERLDATRHPLPDDSAHVFFTDPPYYDAVPYADLSDFFLVWLCRALGDGGDARLSEVLAPKDEECIVDEVKGKDGEFFTGCIQKALTEGRRILVPSGVGTVVFAHKSTRGWESMVQALIDSGWVITGSWPIDTERPGRLRAQASAALASSIHIVCRPRENPDGSVRTNDIGDWQHVLAELPKRIHSWMPRLAEEGVVGADAIFACLGPALEIYSQHSAVERASGEKMTLKEYLEEVWAAVAREALSMIFEGADASGFEEDARLTAMWLWTLRTALNGEEEEDGEVKSFRGYGLEYDAARKIAQGLGAHLENLSHLVEIKGNTATLLSAGARTRYLFGGETPEAPQARRKKKPQMDLDFAEEVRELEAEYGDWSADLSRGPGHQSMILFGAGRSEALRRFLVEDGVGLNPLYWRLAQALSALYPAATEEKRWVDGVLGRKKGFGL
jgi:adenine-specific DNA methylase